MPRCDLWILDCEYKLPYTCGSKQNKYIIFAVLYSALKKRLQFNFEVSGTASSKKDISVIRDITPQRKSIFFHIHLGILSIGARGEGEERMEEICVP